VSEIAADRTLEDWSERLTQALQILDLKVDHALLRELAEKSAAAVTPAAGPISTFLVGYAAGVAATSGTKDAISAVDTAARTALLVVANDSATESAETPNWTSSAQ